MNTSMLSQIEKQQLAKLLNSRIENLRSKLLDLTNRNPLISTKFSDRSNSYIRVVDEVPEVLLNKLLNEEMQITALPPLEEDPKDEQTEEFLTALNEARITDQRYLEELDTIDQYSDNAANLLAQAERSLKDRLREKLNLPKRQTSSNLSLQQHAKAHSIDPSYELGKVPQPHQDNRHTDHKIQTLLLPDVLKRRFKTMQSKENTWKQETGINVLHAAFGFLEWQQNSFSEPCYAPLILLPIVLRYNSTKNIEELWVSGEEAIAKVNSALTEKLKNEFNINLPGYLPEQPLENYFELLANKLPTTLGWKIRRWVTIGVFPSARIAMYNDLGNTDWDFANHQLISRLLNGNEVENKVTLFADEYDSDQTEIQAKAPLLITNVDSSQFSAIIDVMDGKNIAIEGPPGTGKSQTIVNAIAAMLAKGKKVLFVAEKTAALDVVKARLEALGFGNFLLPLQATFSNKSQVITSIKERLAMKTSAQPASDLEEKINQSKQIKSELKKYIHTLEAPYGETGLNVFEILGQSLKFRDAIDALPDSLKNYQFTDLQNISKNDVEEISRICADLEGVLKNTKDSNLWWKDIKAENLDPFKVHDILKKASEAADLHTELNDTRKKLQDYEIDPETYLEDLSKLDTTIKQLLGKINSNHGILAKKLNSLDTVTKVKGFISEATELQKDRKVLETQIKNVFIPNIEEELLEAAKLCAQYNITSLDDETFNQIIQQRELHITNLKNALAFMHNFVRFSPAFEHISVQGILLISDLIAKLSKDALLLRSSRLLDLRAQTTIEKAKKSTDELNELVSILKTKFNIKALPDQEELSAVLNTLIDSHFFSFLSPRYRQAKQYYMHISSSSSFNKKAAINELKQFNAYLIGLADLYSNELLQKLLGSRFEKLDTNYEPYMELFKFFAEIDLHFPGKENEELRTFIRIGDNDALISLTQPTKNHSIRLFLNETFNTINEQTQQFEDELIEIKQTQDYIKKIRSYLHKMVDWNANNLATLAKQTKNFLSRYNETRSNQTIQTLINTRLDEVESRKEDLIRSIELAEYIHKFGHKLGNALLRAVQQNKLNQLHFLLTLIVPIDTQAMGLLKEIESLANLNIKTWLQNKSYSEKAEYLHQSAKDRDGLISFSRLNGLIQEFSRKGYKNFINSILTNHAPSLNITTVFKAMLSHAFARDVYKQYGNLLTKFDGLKLSSLQKQYAELDKLIITLSQQHLQMQLLQNAKPPLGNTTGKKSTLSELSLLTNEVEKKQRFVSIRDLTRRSGKALLELKPCWLMSPLAVAQYISQGSITFDLAIIDEASQMTPENAIGALLRAKQAMIVGDTNQLPPTNFFRKVLDIETDNDEEVTEESILEIANMTFKPARRLRWHYRSEHSGLIAFSNQHIYNNDLIIFPNAYENKSELGVKFKYINDGLYSLGTNTIEAKAIVTATIEFMTKHPNLSLGIVSLNQKQKELIEDEMELAFAKNPDALKYKEYWDKTNEGLEAFFIKNLENVQGNERDVIFISTVYGREATNLPVMQRFGPINGITGKRRLNVLFTRAKKQTITFSSMHASDIHADEHKNPGTHLLKLWLQYCETGILATNSLNKTEPDSDFERFVIKQLESLGYEAIPQVGVSGYYIDIGVRHPKYTNGFIMGIECDGATYHSSKSARNQDRLRQEILEGLGWNIYRIWSTDWFEDPLREKSKLKEAIERRIASQLSY